MTLKQFKRWRVMSLRLARRGFVGQHTSFKVESYEECKLFFHYRSQCQYQSKEKEWARMTEWDSGESPVEIAVDEFLNPVSYSESRLKNFISCCILAGFDIAVKPTQGGVLGWTAGDIRKLWKTRRVPEWVKAYFRDFEEQELDNLSDKDAVWL